MALFVVTFAVALVGLGRRLRIVLVACALVATLAAAAVAADAVNGRSARDVTSGRSRLVNVTLDAFEARPVAGVGIGGQPRASAEESGKGSPSRNASHTTPLTVLAELGVLGFALYVWVLAAAAWALWLLTKTIGSSDGARGRPPRPRRPLACSTRGSSRIPLTWGVFGPASLAGTRRHVGKLLPLLAH